MVMSIPVAIISSVLFIILFFGVGFILNMLFRKTWIMAILYPLVALYFINGAKLKEYFINPSASFQTIPNRIIDIGPADAIILLSGLIGAMASGTTIRLLRNRGYRMF